MRILLLPHHSRGVTPHSEERRSRWTALRTIGRAKAVDVIFSRRRRPPAVPWPWRRVDSAWADPPEAAKASLPTVTLGKTGQKVTLLGQGTSWTLQPGLLAGGVLLGRWVCGLLGELRTREV